MGVKGRQNLDIPLQMFFFLFFSAVVPECVGVAQGFGGAAFC